MVKCERGGEGGRRSVTSHPRDDATVEGGMYYFVSLCKERTKWWLTETRPAKLVPAHNKIVDGRRSQLKLFTWKTQQ
jgi:hypothetical protein